MFPGASAEQRLSFIAMQRAGCTPQDAARLNRMMSEYDAASDCGNVRCPTLVLHSPDDGCIPFEQGRFIASAIPGAQFVPFASINHTPLPGEPAFGEVNRLIDEFVLAAARVHRLPAPTTRPRPDLRAIVAGSARPRRARP